MHGLKWVVGALMCALMGCVVGPDDDWMYEDPEFPSDFEPFPSDPSDGRPDFQLSSVTVPSALGAETQKQVRARLCNEGKKEGSTEVSFFLSRDGILDAHDTWLSTSATLTLSPGRCQDATAKVVASGVTEGSYVLLALADADDVVREADERNNQRSGGTTRVDLTAPGVPELSWAPASGGSQTPRLVALTEAGATVRVYAGGNCAGAPVASTGSNTSAYCEIPVKVSSYPASSYSARSYDSAGNGSGCGSIPAPSGYEEEEEDDTTPPAPPVLTKVEWQYGTTQHGLRVQGTTEPGAEVGIFIDSQCQGFPAATVFAGSSGVFTAELTVTTQGPGSVRRVFVAARDAALNESSCVEGPTYETPCPQGYANCDGDPSNGCEVDLTSDEQNCGACGTSCQATGNTSGVCVASTCRAACPVGTYDCDGDPSNGCESTYECSPTTCTIDRSSELVITSVSVVEDMARATPGGAWHFGTLMRSLAGDQDPSTLIRNWLKTWATAQTVNGQTVPARTQILSKVLGPWEERSGGANRPLNMAFAPFRLLAIVNRMDLRQPGVQAGEGRFVYGVVDPNGNPLEFTVIFEYALPGATPQAIQAWAADWHELGQLGVGHPNYKVQLQTLTDRFTQTGVMPGRPLGSALNQIRTNEVALAEPWEMREFVLTTEGLRPATTKLTPDISFQNTSRLRDYLQANEAAILAEQHTVPETFSGVRFLAGAARTPENFFWRSSGVSGAVRHKFSVNTCNGCHAGETGTEFVHIANRAAGQQAALSVFLRGGTVRDPVTQQVRTFDDLGRRAQDLATLVCGAPLTPGVKGEGMTFEELLGFPAPSNLPRARVH